MQSFKHRGVLISEIRQKHYQEFPQKKLVNQGFLFWELPSTVFRKGVHWTAQLEEIYISIQSDLKDPKF